MRILPVCLTALLLAAPGVNAALTAVKAFSVESLRPANNSYGAGGIAFIPGGTDSIAEDTLVINWRQRLGAAAPYTYSHTFQRITIPADGGTPVVKATAVLYGDTFLYDGVNKFNGATGVSDLAFDPATGKLVSTWTADGANKNLRFFSMDLFSTNTTISSINYSRITNDSTTNGKNVFIGADGTYNTFFVASGNVRNISVPRTGLDGSAAMTTTNAPTASITGGWYPNPAAATNDVYGTNIGLNCEGAVALGSDSVLFLRTFKVSSTVNRMETHLMQVDSALDADAFSNAVDLGNMNALHTLVSGINYSQGGAGYGITLNGAQDTAFVRFGLVNDGSANNRIMVVTGLPAVPEPATLVLLALGGLTLLRRRA